MSKSLPKLSEFTLAGVRTRSSRFWPVRAGIVMPGQNIGGKSGRWQKEKQAEAFR